MKQSNHETGVKYNSEFIDLGINKETIIFFNNFISSFVKKLRFNYQITNKKISDKKYPEGQLDKYQGYCQEYIDKAEILNIRFPLILEKFFQAREELPLPDFIAVALLDANKRRDTLEHILINEAGYAVTSSKSISPKYGTVNVLFPGKQVGMRLDYGNKDSKTSEITYTKSFQRATLYFINSA